MNREQFLARKNTVKTLDVMLSDGVTIKVRKLYQSEVEHMNRNYGTPDKALAGYRYIVGKCALNDDGTPMFEEKDINDALPSVEFNDVQTIATAVTEFSEVGRDAKKS